MAVVFQGAMNALNPVHTIGDQLLEPIQLHETDTSHEDAEGAPRSCWMRSASRRIAPPTTPTSCRAACASA